MTMEMTVEKGLFARITALYSRFESLSEKIVSYPVDLAARYYLGWAFFVAGMGRLEDWGSQGFLFREIHPVPGLPPELAAVITTTGEIVLPLLLWLGLFGRFAAAGLFFMTVVIQFVVGQTPQGIENHIANPEHYWWMLVAAFLWVRGPGPLSLDRLLFKKAKPSA